MEYLRFWFMNTLLGVDQFSNAFLLFGYADESISSRAWRLEARYRAWALARRTIDALARPWQKDHCFEAYTSEQLRRQLPPEFRKPT